MRFLAGMSLVALAACSGTAPRPATRPLAPPNCIRLRVTPRADVPSFRHAFPTVMQFREDGGLAVLDADALLHQSAVWERPADTDSLILRFRQSVSSWPIFGRIDLRVFPDSAVGSAFLWSDFITDFAFGSATAFGGRC